jgi:phage shock protein PspC (stress-responsive transcriptional regulator)
MIDRYNLFRDPAHAVIAGVAAGLAERFAVEAWVIRLVFVLLALGGTPILAVIVYAALALLLPIRPALPEPRSGRDWRYR